MIFSVFLLTSFTLGGHVGVWLTVTFRTVHIASTICKRAFSLRLIHFQERFQKRSSYCVDGLAKTHRNERFFQRSAEAWTGPFNPLTTDCFGRFRSILNDAYFPA